MSAAELIAEDPPEAGAPPWMATFADLMSLLMCFFVLLLSFSEMDAQKYKLIAGSMKQAFGVQNQISAQDIPRGTSIIAQEFSPGRPDPTPIPSVQQQTTDQDLQTLDVLDRDPGTNPDKSLTELNPDEAQELLQKVLEEKIEETKLDAEALANALSEEINQGMVDIETAGRSITIRIRERGSFRSGSATLNPDFVPVMAKLRSALTSVAGDIAVEGHTDNIPISTALFRSNWDLSAQRALSVAHELLEFDELADERFLIIGHADTRPHMENSSIENRASNRRVEIIVRQDLDEETSDTINEIQASNPDILSTLNLN
jgi:chemotaxis protein MotB